MIMNMIISYPYLASWILRRGRASARYDNNNDNNDNNDDNDDGMFNVHTSMNSIMNDNTGDNSNSDHHHTNNAVPGLVDSPSRPPRRASSLAPKKFRKHNSTRKRECARTKLPLMSQIWFHILGWR